MLKCAASILSRRGSMPGDGVRLAPSENLSFSHAGPTSPSQQTTHSLSYLLQPQHGSVWGFNVKARLL